MYTSQKYIRKNFTTHGRNDFNFAIKVVKFFSNLMKKQEIEIFMDFDKNLMVISNERTNFNNKFFEAGDAEIYYQIIRYFKPKKIIEIGSGHSSLLAKQAIKNARLVNRYTSR